MQRTETIDGEIPELLRAELLRWNDALPETVVEFAPLLRARLSKTVACSEFAALILRRDWPWFQRHFAEFELPISDVEQQTFVHHIAERAELGDVDTADLQGMLRRYRNQSMLRIYWRDLHALADVDETLLQLSALADALLEAATEIAAQQMRRRFGDVRSADGEVIGLVILGMGKLGGRELNFSSDIDIIFCYPEDGESDGPKSLNAHEYFARMSRIIIALLDEVTADGFVYRVDTRLRPFGDSGPPVVSFSALESYLLQHGRDWERYAYVKARVVGLQPGPSVLNDLLSNTVRPFVYRRYLDFGVFESLRNMHAMITEEVRRRELRNNVKLGPGGIREAEFIVQGLQLVRGGADAMLQSTELQRVVPLLVRTGGIADTDAAALLSAYCFLRRLENFIQAIRDQQTHDLPESEVDRQRLCLAMGSKDWMSLQAELDQHRDQISRLFSELALRPAAEGAAHVDQFDRLWESNAETGAWRVAFTDSAADGVEQLAELISEFSGRPATQQIGAIAGQRLQRLIPRLLDRVAASQQPVSALKRSLLVIEKVLRRSAYLALLNENQVALSRLVDLCARSQYITEQIARYPVLLDELLDPRSFNDGVSKVELRSELQQRLLQDGADDGESRMQVIAQHQRATLFRIAIADFNDDLPIMKVSDGLTWLAETVLEETLQQAWTDLTSAHGIPQFLENDATVDAEFAVIGYGKLGGLELSYGSDLDVVFLHDSRGKQQRTNGSKSIDNAVFFARLVRRLVHFLSIQTASGILYEVDTRLRPDGQSGLLVTNTASFERYQEENAWTWEHQALLRARAVAGSKSIFDEFERIRTETLTERINHESLRDDVIEMRKRMRTTLDKSDEQQFDLKHGRGGIGDLEFLVQYLVLKEARLRPSVVRFTDNIRQLDALIEIKCLSTAIGSELQDIYRRFRSRSHHLTLDGRAAVVSQEEFVPERGRVSALWDEWLS